ncbi:hypothetical protein PILCRDRAFT_812225, partial [Piloderma croceum F 1598]
MSRFLIVASIAPISRHSSLSTGFTYALSSCEPTHVDGGCFQVSVYVYLFYC